MALNFKMAYPAQVITLDAGYPYGKARNQQTAGDGTGTPWEALLVNDLFGFFQSLLVGASIVPTNTPDRVGASQYVDAIRYYTEHVQGLAHLNGGFSAAGGVFTPGNDVFFRNGFAVEGEVLFFGNVTCGGQFVVEGATQFNGTNQFGGTNVFTGSAEFDAGVQHAGIVDFIGAGRVRKSDYFAADSNSNIHPDDGMTCKIAASASAVRTYTMLTTGSVAPRDEIEFLNFSNKAHVISGATGSGTLPVASGGKPGRAVYRYLFDGASTHWQQIV